jgi:hypothetical protein
MEKSDKVDHLPISWLMRIMMFSKYSIKDMIVDSLRELLEAKSFCEKALWHFTGLLFSQNI